MPNVTLQVLEFASGLHPALNGPFVIIEFPDMDTARAWYRSDAYAPLRELRRSASTTSIVVVDGT